jgi:quinol monooxygenase YgiN
MNLKRFRKGSYLTMYARVTTFQVQPGKIDAWTQITSDSVITVVKQQSGYHSGLVLTDKSANKIMVITLWETEAHMKAGETSGYYQQQAAKVASLLTAPPIREAYAVTFQV